MGKRWGTWGLCAAILLVPAARCEPQLPEKGFVVRRERPAAADQDSARFLRQRRIDELAAAELNAFVELPYRVTLVARSCAGEGTGYDPESRRIELCYDDLAEELELFGRAGAVPGFEELADVVRETVFHEAGHALIDALDLPDDGARAEEDAADRFARLMLLGEGAGGEKTLLTAARSYDLAAADTPDADPRDEHAPDTVRAEAHRCAVYGAAPARHKDLATPERADCATTWLQTRTAWTHDLAPLLRH